MLHSGRKRPNGENTAKIVFRVADVNASQAALLAKGVLMGEIRSPTSDIFVCDGRDPEGNMFTIETHSDGPFSPLKVTATPAVSLTDVNATSRRGHNITFLRDNKFLVAAEVIFVSAFLFIIPYLEFVGLTSALLVVIGLLWLSGNNWSKLGMARPSSWRRTVLIGLSAGLFFTFFLHPFIIDPIIIYLVHTRPNLQVFSSVHHNIVFFIGTLISAWTSAAFAEEMIFRGYLMNRLADLFGHNALGWTIALIVQAVVFASGHSYQGLAGMLSVGSDGILLGLLYLSTKRNLWNCVIAHGLIDTIAFFFLFVTP
jgi:membrane protease YdiL (CAAX protease family)